MNTTAPKTTELHALLQSDRIARFVATEPGPRPDASEPAQKSKRFIRFPGICHAAKELGVSRIHLWFLLTGQRTSPGLLRRYQALKGAAQ